MFIKSYDEWDQMVRVFVWTIRTTTKIYSGHYTPYEVVTGLKPRSPIDPLLASGMQVKKISVDEYVTKLVTYQKQKGPQVRR